MFQLHIPEDQEEARKEALAQLDLMVGRLKEAYDASEAVAKNVRTACGPVGHDDAMEEELRGLRLDLDAEKAKNKQLEQEKRTVEVTMKEALEKRDEELTTAWKEIKWKTLAVESKLKTAGTMEEENQLVKVGAEKTAIELAELKRHYCEWETNLKIATAKKAELEQFVEDFSVELCEKLQAFAADAEEEMSRIKKELNPKRGLLKDIAALSLLRLEERVGYVASFCKLLHLAIGEID